MIDYARLQFASAKMRDSAAWREQVTRSAAQMMFVHAFAELTSIHDAVWMILLPLHDWSGSWQSVKLTAVGSSLSYELISSHRPKGVHSDPASTAHATSKRWAVRSARGLSNLLRPGAALPAPSAGSHLFGRACRRRS